MAKEERYDCVPVIVLRRIQVKSIPLDCSCHRPGLIVVFLLLLTPFLSLTPASGKEEIISLQTRIYDS
jgi:hypothetical protein